MRSCDKLVTFPFRSRTIPTPQPSHVPCRRFARSHASPVSDDDPLGDEIAELSAHIDAAI